MIKTLTAAVALTVLASLATAAEPVKMSYAELDAVVAGSCLEGCDGGHVKGNNGWGNGPDGSNPGSPHGAPLDSKVANDNISGATGVNLNPTTSLGR